MRSGFDGFSYKATKVQVGNLRQAKVFNFFKGSLAKLSGQYHGVEEADPGLAHRCRIGGSGFDNGAAFRIVILQRLGVIENNF